MRAATTEAPLFGLGGGWLKSVRVSGARAGRTMPLRISRNSCPLALTRLPALAIFAFFISNYNYIADPIFATIGQLSVVLSPLARPL
jgi:hypothetical protein